MYSVSVVLKCNWFLRGIICYLVDGLLNFCKIIHGWIRCWERLQCQKLIMEIMIFHHFSFRIVLNLIYWAFKSLSKLHISIETFKNRLKDSFNMRNIFIPQIIMFSVILNQTPSPHIHPPPLEMQTDTLGIKSEITGNLNGWSLNMRIPDLFRG